jgi:sugar phosphate isomerase/epimerase
MNLMICMRGEPQQLPFLPEVVELGAGIELGSYGMLGVRSERDWEAHFTMHQAVRDQFKGPLAIHGPFIGMEYGHLDHLIREAVNRRLDMTFDVAVKLKASRVVLHSGYTREIDLFNLQDSWLKRTAEFWRGEIRRWADASIEIVLENDTEQSPDILVRLVNAVDHPFLGLCLDIGHQHVFSEINALEWVRRMDQRLYHIHLHDNDGTRDSHSSIGRGTIDFEPFYAVLMQCVPQATLSLEVEDKMEVKMGDLRNLNRYFALK